MSQVSLRIGTQIDMNVRGSSHSVAISTNKARTMQDLLAVLQKHKYIAMLRTTAGHISACLKVPLKELSIEALVGLPSLFTAYLRARHHKRNAIRSYCNYAAILLREARHLGWIPCKPQVPEAWKGILNVAKAAGGGCAGIVHYAISQGKMPRNFSDEDLRLWSQMMLSRKRSFGHVRNCKARFRRALSQTGLARQLPGVSHREAFNYGVALEHFAEQLRAEVTALLDWKQAPYSEGRSREWKIREITANHLKATLQRLYGFVKTHHDVNALHAPINSLLELFTKKSVGAFIKYLLNERKVHGDNVKSKLASLCAAMKQRYKGQDFAWFDELLSGVEPSTESELWTRKEATLLPYEKLVEVAEALHQQRDEITKMGVKPLASLVRNELLLRWLLIMAWRQRNVRELRLGSNGTQGNLFKDKVSLSARVNVPRWAKEMMRANPDTQFWQYRFQENETKTGHSVHSILPRRLVPLLQEYIEHYRPILLGERPDPGTLFVNRRGRPLSQHAVEYLVGELTLRYGGKWVNPHRFRDAFAFWWLRQHPQDFLTVSKKLWHRNVETTLRIYGCKFDESEADCRIEEYAESCADSAQGHQGTLAHDRETMEAVCNLISKHSAFEALSPAAKKKELSAIANIIQGHPWLAPLLDAGLGENAAGVVRKPGSERARREVAA